MPFSKLCFPRQLPEQLWEQESKAVVPAASRSGQLSGWQGGMYLSELSGFLCYLKIGHLSSLSQ